MQIQYTIHHTQYTPAGQSAMWLEEHIGFNGYWACQPCASYCYSTSSLPVGDIKLMIIIRLLWDCVIQIIRLLAHLDLNVLGQRLSEIVRLCNNNCCCSAIMRKPTWDDGVQRNEVSVCVMIHQPHTHLWGCLFILFDNNVFNVYKPLSMFIKKWGQCVWDDSPTTHTLMFIYKYL